MRSATLHAKRLKWSKLHCKWLRITYLCSCIVNPNIGIELKAKRHSSLTVRDSWFSTDLSKLPMQSAFVAATNVIPAAVAIRLFIELLFSTNWLHFGKQYWFLLQVKKTTEKRAKYNHSPIKHWTLQSYKRCTGWFINTLELDTFGNYELLYSEHFCRNRLYQTSTFSRVLTWVITLDQKTQPEFRFHL